MLPFINFKTIIFFKTIANSLSQSQEINIFSQLINFDVIHVSIVKFKMAAKYFTLCQNLKLSPVDVLLKILETELKWIVTLILLNARDLSKIITLYM